MDENRITLSARYAPPIDQAAGQLKEKLSAIPDERKPVRRPGRSAPGWLMPTAALHGTSGAAALFPNCGHK